jgi:hypothetical protein
MRTCGGLTALQLAATVLAVYRLSVASRGAANSDGQLFNPNRGGAAASVAERSRGTARTRSRRTSLDHSDGDDNDDDDGDNSDNDDDDNDDDDDDDAPASGNPASWTDNHVLRARLHALEPLFAQLESVLQATGNDAVQQPLFHQFLVQLFLQVKLLLLLLSVLLLLL